MLEDSDAISICTCNIMVIFEMTATWRMAYLFHIARGQIQYDLSTNHIFCSPATILRLNIVCGDVPWWPYWKSSCNEYHEHTTYKNTWFIFNPSFLTCHFKAKTYCKGICTEYVACITIYKLLMKYVIICSAIKGFAVVALYDINQWGCAGVWISLSRCGVGCHWVRFPIW